MENQIKQVDENLLNNTQFVTTDSETTEEQQQEIKTNENSNFNILSSNIDTLIEKVNQAVKVETERKAKEQEEKALQEELAKFKGTYIYTHATLASTAEYSLDADGTLTNSRTEQNSSQFLLKNYKTEGLKYK